MLIVFFSIFLRIMSVLLNMVCGIVSGNRKCMMFEYMLYMSSSRLCLSVCVCMCFVNLVFGLFEFGFRNLIVIIVFGLCMLVICGMLVCSVFSFVFSMLLSCVVCLYSFFLLMILSIVCVDVIVSGLFV